MDTFIFPMNRIEIKGLLKIYLVLTLFLFGITLRADSNSVKVWIKVSSPVNVQVFLNKKRLMQIDRSTGKDYAYRLVETNLDSFLDFKGKSFSFRNKLDDFYFEKTSQKHISKIISIKIRIGKSNQADLILTPSQLSLAFGDEKDIPALISLLNEHSSDNAESKRLYAAKALGYIGKERTDVKDALVNALQNEGDYRVKVEITKSLGKFDDPSVLSVLKEEFWKSAKYLSSLKDKVRDDFIAVFKRVSEKLEKEGFGNKEEVTRREKQEIELTKELPKETEAKSISLEELKRIYDAQQEAGKKNDYKKIVKLANGGLKGVIWNKLPYEEDGDFSEEQLIFLNIVFERANANLNLKEYQKAILDYKFILKNYPNSGAYVYKFYANALYNAKNKKQAFFLLEKAIEKFKNNNNTKALLLSQLANLFFEEKNYEMAIKFKKQAYEIDTSEERYYHPFNISTNYLLNGDNDSFIQWFFVALNLSFGNQNVFHNVIKYWNNGLLEKIKGSKQGTKYMFYTSLWFLRKAIDYQEEDFELSKYKIKINKKSLEFLQNQKPEFHYIIGAYYSRLKNWELTDSYLERNFPYRFEFLKFISPLFLLTIMPIFLLFATPFYCLHLHHNVEELLAKLR